MSLEKVCGFECLALSSLLGLAAFRSLPCSKGSIFTLFRAELLVLVSRAGVVALFSGVIRLRFLPMGDGT